MSRFGETKVKKESVMVQIDCWDVRVDNEVISKLCETKKNNSKYLTEYLDEGIIFDVN